MNLSRIEFLFAFVLLGTTLTCQPTPQIRITNPVEGAKLIRGAPVSITVELSGVAPNHVTAIALGADFDTSDAAWIKIAPDASLLSSSVTFNVIIPPDAIPGPHVLTVDVGLGDSSGNAVASPATSNLSVQIEPASIAKPLSIEGNATVAVKLNFAGDESRPFHIRDADGIFVDRSTLVIVRSDNPEVAVVNRADDLTIRATGPGMTKVWFEDTPVTVEVANAKRGDYNADGLINTLDVQILDGIASIGRVDLQAAHPPNDARDLNGDGTINAADVTMLRTLCDFPNCTIFAAPKAIKPLVGCVEPAGTANRAAYFSYRNENARAWPLPVGERNFVSPGAQNQGQPAWFESGTVSRAFSVPFTGGTIVWTLKGPDGTQDTATASGSSEVCQP